MPRAVFELQGYAIVLDKVAFVSRVFEADDGDGWKFGIRFSSDIRILPVFASRSDAELQRSLLIQALRES